MRGGERSENAHLLAEILSGRARGPKSEVVALNAAAGFVVAGISKTLADGLQLAKDLLQNGKALSKLKALQAF